MKEHFLLQLGIKNTQNPPKNVNGLSVTGQHSTYNFNISNERFEHHLYKINAMSNYCMRKQYDA